MEINPDFNGKNVTLYLKSGTKLVGTLDIVGGEVWLLDQNKGDQQINPTAIATITETPVQPLTRGWEYA